MIEDEELKLKIDFAVRAGAKSGLLGTEIRKEKKIDFTSKDIHNMTHSINKVHKVYDLEELLDYLQQGTNSTVKLNVGESENQVKTIFWQNDEMKDNFNEFPEVICLDDTEKSNKEGYTISGAIGTNCHGNGALYAVQVKDYNTQNNIERMLQNLKETSPEACSKLKVVIIDKDCKEINAIKRLLPWVRILLCQFHVPKALREAITNTKFGVHSQVKARVLGLMKELMRAETEVEVEVLERNLLSYLSALGNDKLHEYIVNNWLSDEVKRMWIDAFRQDIPHLGNNTTNRIESFWKTLKSTTSRYDSLTQVLHRLRDIVCTQGIDCFYRWFFFISDN